jgi:hypothetical protein
MTPALDAAVDRALASALRKPAVPADLRAQVMAAVARECVPDWQQSVRALEDDRRRAIAALNARYLRRCRDALLGALVLCITIDSGMKPLIHWLAGFFSGAAPLIAGALALGLGVACGALFLRDLLAPSASADHRP